MVQHRKVMSGGRTASRFRITKPFRPTCTCLFEVIIPQSASYFNSFEPTFFDSCHKLLQLFLSELHNLCLQLLVKTITAYKTESK